MSGIDSVRMWSSTRSTCSSQVSPFAVVGLLGPGSATCGTVVVFVRFEISFVICEDLFKTMSSNYLIHVVLVLRSEENS